MTKLMLLAMVMLALGVGATAAYARGSVGNEKVEVLLEVEGLAVKPVLNFNGLKETVGVIEHKKVTPDGREVVEKIAGRKGSPSVIVHVAGMSSEFTGWLEAAYAVQPSGQRSAALVFLSGGGVEVARVDLGQVWPSSVEFVQRKGRMRTVVTLETTGLQVE